MRTGAAAGHPGYFHEAAVYGSDDELVDVVVPFLRDGADAGEPTLVMLSDGNAALVRRALGRNEGIRFESRAAQYDRPASTIRACRELFGDLVAGGATQIRVVGDVPHPGTGTAWERWARYEAAVNHAYDEFPIWGVCPYDARITPPEVLADVDCTHPHVATAAGEHLRNERFVDPASFLAGRPAPPIDPVQRTAPDVVLLDPAPADARWAVVTAATVARLSAEELAGLTLAVSELVTNAHAHGLPPVTVEAWTRPGRVVVAVGDAGSGPDDPFIGLVPVPRDRADGGLGVWLAEQVCDDVVLTVSPSGFNARIAVGRSISS